MNAKGLVAFCLVLTAAASACDDEPSKADSPPGTHPPRDAGRTLILPPPTPGPGTELDGSTAFAADAGVRADECMDITPVPFVGEDMIDGEVGNAIAAPADLKASRIVAAWSGRCNPPVIVVAMSDGHCLPGSGHELTFELDATAIADGRLGTGLHDFAVDGGTAGLRVRYVRPPRIDPSGTWGNCDGAATGTFSVIGELTTFGGRDMQASFEMDLPPCDGSTQEVQHVQGTFAVRLRRDLEDVCPPP